MRSGVNTRNCPNYHLKYDARQLRSTLTVAVKLCGFIGVVCVFIDFM